MDGNVVECGAPALGVLRDVQRAYRDRLALVDRIGGSKKLQMKVEVLESWVSDLVAQNTLLASTIEELETEVTSRLLEKRRHAEIEIELRAEADTLRRQLVRKDSDLRGLLEVLRRLREFDFYAIDGIHFNEVTESDIFGSVLWQHSKLEQGDNKTANERQGSKKEIRRLNKDLQHYEQTIMSLRNELSVNSYHTPDIPKKDAEVMADISTQNRRECDDVEPVKESELAIGEHPVYQERMQQLEHSAKLSSDFRSLRHENVALREKLSAMQRVCVALDEQCRVAAVRAQFKDDVIHEMRRQLRQTKAKSPSPPILISDSSVEELDEAACDCAPCPFASDKGTGKVESSSSENVGKLNSGEIEATRERDVSKRHQDSIVSSVETAASDAVRTRSLENKLMATMLILKNKEETIRVQAESLSLAEARIAALNSKCHQSASKLHQAQQTNPLNTMRSSADGNQVEMADVSTTVADSNIVNTLRDNLSVIEEFYRECFYETAKQEELITMLRRSYLDMKLVERQKSDQIDFLQNTLKSQKSSIERYEDIAMEVENLKTEISNFLNNSTNNDSGVWGCEPAAELRDIARQLRRLHDMLRTDCICGLGEENVELKRRKESMEIQIGELRQRVCGLEAALEDKTNMDQQYSKQIEEKEKELHRIRQQLAALEQGSQDRGSACDTLTFQLKRLEAMLNDKSAELLNTQQLCESHEVTIRDLRAQLHKADLIVTENQQVRAEVSSLSAQVTQWRDQLAESRRRLRALEDELRRATDHCRHLATHYREKAETASTLQAQLAEAQQRGAELCAEVQRAVRGVRRCLAEQRARRR
ncbi:leucine-rich repeat and coiled-coil domain-containing protein 1-like [Vanessa atalanta]|uniref:leucine-rich repeat and coiled-coil domain-containing protein 1-like n=1 Tax=Vanessa atalanta TaxID=42275 RepID=UPI001FCD59EC|nr:leucine-rich repeat and coiled-coil domain-containing protein 1-like [Vanessa atalanta]